MVKKVIDEISYTQAINAVNDHCPNSINPKAYRDRFIRRFGERPSYHLTKVLRWLGYKIY